MRPYRIHLTWNCHPGLALSHVEEHRLTETGMLSPAARVPPVWNLLDLPEELLEHVIRMAFEHGSLFAATSRAVRDTALRAAEARNIFELVVHVALRRIPGDDIGERMLLVSRALAAGHHADLFTWPCEPPGSGFPWASPLRKHACPHSGIVAHSLPLEHNLMVHVAQRTNSLKDASFVTRLSSIAVDRGLSRGRGGEGLPLRRKDVLVVHLNAKGEGLQVVLGGKQETARNINIYNAECYRRTDGLFPNICCRRMVVVLQDPRRYRKRGRGDGRRGRASLL